MTSPKKTFENLQRELQQETRLQPKDRSKEYEELTLQHFQEHDRTVEDHGLWRECHMLEEMIAILNRRYLAINPHKKRQLELKQLSRESALEIYVEYQQEVDDEGRSAEEIDNRINTMYPDIERRDLEIQAAENYLSTTWGIQRKKQTTTPPEQRVHEEKASKNPNPILTYKELRNEFWKNDHNAVKEAVTRGISQGLKGAKKRPWLLKGIASEYQIAEAEIRHGFDKPTPSSCKYQKTHQEGND
jgi:hypothetical protein